MKATTTMGPCAAVSLVVTLFLFPTVFASNEEHEKHTPTSTNVCTSGTPLTLTASSESPLTFVCPESSYLLPSKPSSAFKVVDDTCGEPVQLSTLEVDATLEVKSHESGASQESPRKEYTFTVTKLPTTSTSVCYKCVVPPPAPTSAEEDHDEDAHVAQATPVECQVKIVIPAEPVLKEREAVTAVKEVTETSTPTTTSTQESAASSFVCPAAFFLVGLTLLSFLA
ncbi:sag-related sequence srs26i [Cystoisospora suis]|uniref:Sag-related sequence srs26i n=1 Tax=Cystoisospora suis TaxID=483139 RepID=A0A2C6L1W4_9APIC|nr:sag-related sequence srs26i [Cystoisospora suis]